MAVSFQRFDDPKQFFATVKPMLAAREVENGLMLGAALALAESGDRAFLAAAFRDGVPIVAALRMAPYDLTVSAAAAVEVPPLVDGILALGELLPGVFGVDVTAAAFADCWTARTSQHHELRDHLLFYKLRALVPPAAPPRGALRAATNDDADWLTEWHIAYASEAGLPEPERTPDYAAEMTRTRIAAGVQFVWEVEAQAAAMVACCRTGLTGTRVLGVWTEPSQRRKGYASAAVAALVQHQLDRGTTWCGLFADSANPQSNSIYRRLGFQEVCRYHSIRFTAAGERP